MANLVYTVGNRLAFYGPLYALVCQFVKTGKMAGISSNEQHNSIMYKPFPRCRHKFILALGICRF